MTEISALVPPMIGNEWLNLWREYEDAKTTEAMVVKQLDKFDMIAQAFSYEKKYGLDLSEFFNCTVNSFSTEPFTSWNQQLRNERENFKDKMQHSS